jgi:hypothetical protein
MGNFRDSWKPIGNITFDVIDDLNKRKIQKMENKLMARV